MHPKDISIIDYTYQLPGERIARYPLAARDESRLLVYKDGNIREDIYLNLDDYLPDDSFLVFNNTRVIEARILFQKPTGAFIEIFCLEPYKQYADFTSAMLQKERIQYKCLIGGAGKWKPGMVLHKAVADFILSARIVGRTSEAFIIELSWNKAEMTFAGVLHSAGVIPLPPYLHRDAEDKDKETYQTVYAKKEGSVAAPTAGLHFTPRLFKKLDKKSIHYDFVTLHVGAGTFKPVKAEKMEGHEMHAEYIEAELSFIENLIKYIDNVVAVGTTSLRTIESLYWIGVKLSLNPKAKSKNEMLMIHQWDAYELKAGLSATDALRYLIDWMKKHKLQKFITKTQIIIAPGYDLKIAKGLVTNFHQPQSTLLLLVAAIVGDDWRRIYDYAIKNDFRFLSYGDGSLLWTSTFKSKK